MKKIIRLTESDLTNIVKRVIVENNFDDKKLSEILSVVNDLSYELEDRYFDMVITSRLNPKTFLADYDDLIINVMGKDYRKFFEGPDEDDNIDNIHDLLKLGFKEPKKDLSKNSRLFKWSEISDNMDRQKRFLEKNGIILVRAVVHMYPPGSYEDKIEYSKQVAKKVEGDLNLETPVNPQKYNSFINDIETSESNGFMLDSFSLIFKLV